MIKTISVAFATVTLAAATFSAHAALEIGSAIPQADKPMKATNGKMITLQQAKGEKGLIVMFSCNTCPFVIKSQARTHEMMELAKAKGFGFIIINSNEAQRDDEDSYDAMKKYAEQQKYNVPYVVDEKSAMADLFGATRTPEVFLFNAEGTLAYRGAMEDNPINPKASKEMFLRMAIDAVANGKSAAPNTTKSIGCGIKRQ